MCPALTGPKRLKSDQPKRLGLSDHPTESRFAPPGLCPGGADCVVGVYPLNPVYRHDYPAPQKTEFYKTNNPRFICAFTHNKAKLYS